MFVIRNLLCNLWYPVRPGLAQELKDEIIHTTTGRAAYINMELPATAYLNK